MLSPASPLRRRPRLIVGAFYVVTPMFEILRFIPPLAWVPFAILWFGVGAQASAFVIVTGVLPPVLINTYVGARAVPRAFKEELS